MNLNLNRAHSKNKAGIQMAALPDVEASGKRWNLPQVFVEGDLGGPCLEFSGIGFLSMYLQSLAQCIPLRLQGQIFGGFLFLYIFSLSFFSLRAVPF